MNQDILKLIVVLAAFIYLNLKVRPRAKALNYWVMNIGLCLLIFASVLDFTDGFKVLDDIPVLGKKDPFHDLLEDQFGDTPGLALFALGAFKEILRKRP